jgi:hypothetical protein
VLQRRLILQRPIAKQAVRELFSQHRFGLVLISAKDALGLPFREAETFE